jgi:hypothetical protein
MCSIPRRGNDNALERGVDHPPYGPQRSARPAADRRFLRGTRGRPPVENGFESRFDFARCPRRAPARRFLLLPAVSALYSAVSRSPPSVPPARRIRFGRIARCSAEVCLREPAAEWSGARSRPRRAPPRAPRAPSYRTQARARTSSGRPPRWRRQQFAIGSFVRAKIRFRASIAPLKPRRTSPSNTVVAACPCARKRGQVPARKTR